MKADEKDLIDQKAFRCTSMNFIYSLKNRVCRSHLSGSAAEKDRTTGHAIF
jgi:hypothetical protein